ncbi:unnamed protein product [Nesidiocoris tenuis]|uniref:Uncharacterized protein n=1 Tax=Nesidiocoris tenuis TaxID=355587 RepID=A0A6H5G5I3_9HEMI|nr:unnamed protein product [Nesidiocoris tenuis]
MFPARSVQDVKAEPGTSTGSGEPSSALSDPAATSPKKKRRLPRPRVRKSFDSDSGPSIKRGRKTGKADSPVKAKGVKRPNQERFKDTSNDSHSLGLSSSTRKGPFVRIEGPKDRPKRVRVVNSGAKDEDDRDGGLDKAMVRRKHNAQAESKSDFFAPTVYHITFDLTGCN